jgi:hypothetical protein
MSKSPKTYAARKQAAFTAGLAAFKEGKVLSACPIAKHQGLRRSWTEGWVAGSAEQKKQSSGMFIAKTPAIDRGMVATGVEAAPAAG